MSKTIVDRCMWDMHMYVDPFKTLVETNAKRSSKGFLEKTGPDR